MDNRGVAFMMSAYHLPIESIHSTIYGKYCAVDALVSCSLKEFLLVCIVKSEVYTHYIKSLFSF